MEFFFYFSSQTGLKTKTEQNTKVSCSSYDVLTDKTCWFTISKLQKFYPKFIIIALMTSFFTGVSSGINT